MHNDDEVALRDLVSAETRTYTQAGGKMKTIAQATGLSHSTISKLVHHETRFPRLHTVLAVLKFFGYKISANKVVSKIRLVK